MEAEDGRRLDLAVYGATRSSGALSVATPRSLRVTERRKLTTYSELSRGGPQQLVVLGSEAGGRWNESARTLAGDLVRLKAHRAPPAVHVVRGAAGCR